MPHASWVTGSFHYADGCPVEGTVRFVPAQMWVYDQGVYWASLAPECELKNGRFGTWLTVTQPWWTYQMESPAGCYTFTVPPGHTSYTLPELLNEHHPPTGA